MTPFERLLNKIETIPEAGCWIWLGTRNPGGYGMITVDRRSQLVHRIAYEHLKGTIPEGLDLDHLCRVRSCCNPDHLEIVTRRVNIMRGIGVAAQHSKKTHCIHGHPLLGETIKPFPSRPNHHRVCRTCRQLSQVRSRRLLAEKHGRKHSPEHRAKISAGVMAAHARRKALI